MISSLTGTLAHVDEDRIHLAVGPIVYEAMVPASDIPSLITATGQELTFHTILYFEGDASGGNMEPRLVAFLRKEDKRFFQKFITVKGIGPKKALKALIHPAAEIARAIEEKDSRFLVGLPQIGKRMAEQIVAELAGKVAAFAVNFDPAIRAANTPAPTRRPQNEEDAIAALMALGDRRGEAEGLLERAKSGERDLKTTDELVREMLRLRTAR